MFSHRRHAPLKLECKLCHATSETKERAGYPRAETCAVCHREMKTPRLKPLARAYHVPDFVIFSHAAHRAAKIECRACHGDVWKNEFGSPAAPPTMMGCVNCHKANGAKTACNACHELLQ